MAQHRIILDCDPGQDDAVAILLALASPDEIELLALTTVAGNVPLARTTRNAQQLLALAGRDAGWRLHGEPDGALSLERRDAPR